ncbi:BEL1-like homeodomain 1 [Actinidia rufa]|uniref:BEL1-like homeodomain 1 n=1 Tax=Actinidia rufa TaxID=165716 RepID=A0A7J0HB07_9ERIC|nr:BEL1-like homeodomain 1 [Actinidia rufa]
MATYYHGGSDIQADGLHTLYLMNPNYLGCSDTQPPPPQPNMLFLNSAASVSHAPPHQNHHFVGIPLSTIGSVNPDDPNHPSVHEIPRFHHNLWANASGNHPDIPRAVATGSSDGTSQLGFLSPTSQQGLSLSLSSQRPAYRSLAGIREFSGSAVATNGSLALASNGVCGVQGVILGSKYLKAAQEVLDEVVNVGMGIKTEIGEGMREKEKVSRESGAGSGDGSSGGETRSKGGAELTTAQRQDLQMKKAKLVSMLDEVEQRYRQYHHQMQIVASSFEQAAGIGSANSYTALALQTISKQFRCLKDAITTQIKATSKSMSEDDSLGGKVEGSRLKFVDHQLRQQRALQHLGMIQHNAWRPQRGLPERAVSVLRAWLFEHFLHPYPKDSDKHILAKQTGLTRSQVSNWFINARVRLWKPMVEEMYLEEMKDHEQNRSDKTNMSNGEPNQESDPKSTRPQESNTFTGSSSEMEELIVQRSPKKLRSYDKQSSPSSILSMDMDTKPCETTTIPGNGFGTYPISDIGRFDPNQLVTQYPGNSVSLTLGLPHCENPSLSGTQQSFFPMGSVETHYGSINTPQASHSTDGYENISIQNRKIFAAQLLPDFVA